jgi:hypothetical protein
MAANLRGLFANFWFANKSWPLMPTTVREWYIFIFFNFCTFIFSNVSSSWTTEVVFQASNRFSSQTVTYFFNPFEQSYFLELVKKYPI